MTLLDMVALTCPDVIAIATKFLQRPGCSDSIVIAVQLTRFPYRNSVLGLSETKRRVPSRTVRGETTTTQTVK